MRSIFNFGLSILDWQRYPRTVHKFLLLMLAMAILAAPLVAYTGQPKNVPRIGILCSLTCGTYPVERFDDIRVFQDELTKRGYVDGQNIAIDFRAAGGGGEVSRLAAKLVSSKVDIILAAGDPAAAMAAANATKTIPIITVGGTDAVQLGLVRNLARPGGNITGVTVPFGELAGKQLDLLKEILPGISRIGTLWNPKSVLHRQTMKEIEATAKSLSLQLSLLEARTPADFDRAVATAARNRAGALLALWDPLFGRQNQGRLSSLALKQRLPLVSQDRGIVSAAGLMSYGPNIPEMYRRAAYFVEKILRGAKPAELPAEQPTQFHLAINLTTARALDLTIPQSVLIRADEVIQ